MASKVINNCSNRHLELFRAIRSHLLHPYGVQKDVRYYHGYSGTDVSYMEYLKLPFANFSQKCSKNITGDGFFHQKPWCLSETNII
jgi:hypothetical protein